MYAPKHLFNRCRGLLAFAFLCGLVLSPVVQAQEAEFSKQEAGLYSDVFNDNIYYEFTDYLNFANLYRKITHKKTHAANVNLYDEVPDSTFYTNRHARKRLSADELSRGALTGSGPDLSAPLTVISGKSEGLHPGFFVRDSRGDVYLFKFDPPDNLELTTSAEVIVSRIYHALGYNVSQSTIALVDPSQFKPAPDATFYDHRGFKSPLKQEDLDELLLFIPYTEDGKLRASAIKFVEGDIKGPFSFRGRRHNDPDDLVPHENRREIRALRVFSSWVNNYDVRRSNTLQALVAENGNPHLKNYIIDYNASLGAGTHEAKPPMFTYEHMLDYGEAAKAYFSAGFWEKPWQKKWREAGEKTGSPAVGYFDNRTFDPGKYKVQLPARAFKSLTHADAFWAAKIIMTFSDEDIRTLVKTGQYTSKDDEAEIARVLIERRDLIGRYWFAKANPLDEFDLSGGKLIFTDLAVQYAFEKAGNSVYQAEVLGASGKKNSWITSVESAETAIAIDPSWFSANETVQIVLRTARKGTAKVSPAVTVTLSRDSVQDIIHQD